VSLDNGTDLRILEKREYVEELLYFGVLASNEELVELER